MTNTPESAHRPGASPLRDLARRLETKKLDALTVVLFFAALAAMSAAAAGIGFLTHHLFKH